MSGRWLSTVVPATTGILEAIQTLDAAGLQILLVVEEDGRLVGTVTDGDVRRAILMRQPFDGPISSVMHRDPTTAPLGTGHDEGRRRMRAARVRQLPIVDTHGRPVGLELPDDESPSERPNSVLIMAGGLGQRLRPLTDEVPKPLLRVGGRPLLETIIESFAEHGMRRFYLSVNYRADQVERHFGDGSRLGVHIEYVRESSFLGTGGALSLLPAPPTAPLLVMNGDILTRVNFGQLIEFHGQTHADMTMCVREYEVEVPFGVVEVEDERIVSLVEKPTTRHFINAGIYVINPELVATIRRAEHLDMTDLAVRVLQGSGNLSAFPIREYWLDIGHLEDFERAQADFARNFR